MWVATQREDRSLFRLLLLLLMALGITSFDRHCKRTLNGPSVPINSIFNSVPWNLSDFCPLGDCFLLASKYQKSACCFVIALLLYRYPSAVGWLIGSIHIDTVNGKLIGVAIGQCPSLKAQEVRSPFSAHMYTATTIVFVSCVMGVFTP